MIDQHKPSDESEKKREKETTDNPASRAALQKPDGRFFKPKPYEDCLPGSTKKPSMDNRIHNQAVLDRTRALDLGRRLREERKCIVFTNGCFDLLHVGHLRYLTFARQQGDILVVGLNSDASVKRNKGSSRPLLPELERAEMLAGLKPVDYVVIFDEDEPRDLIGEVQPDVLVKGADWAHYVSGRDIVEANGGRVVLADLIPGRSTTSIIEAIKRL